MKKLNKIFSVLLTAALLTGMLVTSALPVSAGTQEWTQIDTPDVTKQVKSDISATGLLTQAADGTLYASATVGTAYFIISSDDNGKTWAWNEVSAAIDAIAVAPDNSSVVYIAIDNTVYKSIDGGESFAMMASVPDGSAGPTAFSITTMAVGFAGGAYKVFVGGNHAATDEADIYYMDEANFFFAFNTIGTPSFQTTYPDADTIYDIALSPDFATDKGIVVLAEDNAVANDVIISFNVNGGAWGSTVDALVSADGDIPGSIWGGVIALPSDFNILTSPFFYVGIDGTSTGSGVWRVFGSATDTTASRLPYFSTEIDVFSLDVLGTFASCAIVLGTDNGAVFTSANSGATWTEGSNVTGPGDEVFVAFDNDFAANGKVYAMTVAGGTDDDSAFQVSMDQGANFAQVSLVNTTWTNIDEAAFAANGDIFIIASNTTYDSLWRYTAANGWERVSFYGGFTMLKLSPNYATDGTIFVVESDLINKSVNNGKTFEAQLASPGAINDYAVIDMNTFVVATSTDIFRTTTGGFLWDDATGASATVPADVLVRSSDGTAMAAIGTDNKVYRSANNGATWDAGTAALTNISAITFQYGSNAVIWATTTDDTVYSSASRTAAWASQPDVLTGDGVAIVSGIPGDFAIYTLDANGKVSRLLKEATNAEALTATGLTDGAQIFIVPGNGANQLFVNGDTAGLWTYTDTLAVPVTGVGASGIATTQTSFLSIVTGTSTATIFWDEIANADSYTYEVGTTDPGKDLFSASGTSTDETSVALTGLDPDTVYYVSVWVDAPVSSFVGQFSFATPPTAPIIQGPGPSATNIPVNPTFQWSSVSGATSYTVELSTTPDFANKTVLDSAIPVIVWDTNAPLANGTDYYWSVQATTANGTSAKTYGVFTTKLAEEPPVTVTTTTQPNITLTQLPAPDQETPGYIWIIIAIGGILTVLVIVLIVRTRRVV